MICGSTGRDVLRLRSGRGEMRLDGETRPEMADSPHPERSRRIGSNPPLDEGQQPARRLDQDGVDLVRAEAAPPHHRHDVLENMAVAVTAELGDARSVAAVVRDG